MSQTKVAPVLARSLHYIPGRAGTRAKATAEFNALAALARAVRRHHVTSGGYDWKHIERALVRCGLVRPSDELEEYAP